MTLSTVQFETDIDSKKNGNILDKVMISMAEDAKRNGGKIQMLNGPLFDPTLLIERLDINDSKILELAYNKSGRN